MNPTLEQINAAFDRAIQLGYFCYVSVGTYGDKINYNCNLRQDAHSGAGVQVQGSGETLEEAVRKCFSNFPENPLDGTGWKNNRLVPPKSEAPIEGEYVEVREQG